MLPLATCDCCSGVMQHTPLPVENRPGLSAIAYRVGTHADFRSSLIAGLTDLERPRLADLGTRDDDDFTIALLDAWAMAADVLTFYNERLASESYLRTARQRESLQELGRLTGYRLRPGAAAQTHLAFAIDHPPKIPDDLVQEPGTTPRVTPEAVELPDRLRVQGIPEPGEKPQTFETLEAIEARPEWNLVPVAQKTAQMLKQGDTHVYLDGIGLNIKRGDVLLLAGADILAESWDVRVVSAVKEEPEPKLKRTRVEWADGLGSSQWGVAPAAVPEAHVLRKRIPIFGHNAPAQNLINGSDEEWGFNLSPKAEPYVDLDGSHPDVVAGSFVVLSAPTYRELWRVEEVTELSRAEFAVSGKVTRLKLKDGENYSTFASSVRETTVFAVSDPFALAEALDPSVVSGDFVDVKLDASKMQPGRRLLIAGKTTSGKERVEAVVIAKTEPHGAGSRITFEDPLEAEYDRQNVLLYGNAALASHGETVHEHLGSGRAADAFQRFDLKDGPLTHVRSTSDSSGAAPSLDVFVNDVKWAEAPTLYGARPGDRAYALRTDEKGTAYVQFGDGARAARLPTGTNNVRARYRKGIGAAGNVKAQALSQLLDRPLGVKGVTNPAEASGGVDREAPEAARRTMPLGVRTLDRAVSLLDYEDFALAFTGVSKANAAVVDLRGQQTIVLTVAFDGGDRVDDLRDTLLGKSDGSVPVQILPAVTETFRLALKVAVDPGHESKPVLAGVENALRTAYAFVARDLIQSVVLSELIAIVHALAGVVAVDVDRLYTGANPDRSERLVAQRAAAAPDGTHANPAGVLVIDPAPFDWLEEMT